MYENLNELSEEIQLKAVRKDGYSIRYIDNPSEELKLEAVKQNGYAIEYIDNPSFEMKLEAVKQSSSIIVDLKMDNNDINNILNIYHNIDIIQYLISVDYQFTKEFMDNDDYIKAKLLMK